MTREATLTLIRLHLKSCPQCGGDVSAAADVVCGKCGRDLTNDAAGVARTRKTYFDDRWVKTAVVAVLPSIIACVWLLMRIENLRRRDPEMPRPMGFFGFTLVLCVVVSMIAFSITRAEQPSFAAKATLVVLAWVVTVAVFVVYIP